MKKITWLYMNGCPYCRAAGESLEELKAEDPKYLDVEIEMYEESENASFASQFDYYYVPSFFIGTEKLYECSPGAGKQEIKAAVKYALDRSLAETPED